MQGYRREAAHRERQRPVDLQDWSRFQAWWDASCRQCQGYLLTPEETAILKRPEPSLERRMRIVPQPVLTTSAASAPGHDTLMSDAELDALFEDHGE